MFLSHALSTRARSAAASPYTRSACNGLEPAKKLLLCNSFGETATDANKTHRRGGEKEKPSASDLCRQDTGSHRVQDGDRVELSSPLTFDEQRTIKKAERFGHVAAHENWPREFSQGNDKTPKRR